ncbi:MAG: glycosyltransferase family A protein, partial [Oscillospiraceae bacterium]
MPVYNVEKYLGWCINSILKQTYRDIELILVDDGSTDNSLQICQNYERLDTRVKVISVKNNGVSNARNIGVKSATGEYIQFVDSDDLISPEMTETLLKSTQKYNKNLVICSMLQVSLQKDNTPKLNKLGLYKKDAELVLSYDAWWEHLLEFVWNTSAIEGPCNKLYLKSIIVDNNICFSEEFSLGEDFLFNLDYLKYCNGAVFIDKPLYYYMDWVENSLTSCCSVDLLKILVKIEESLVSYIEQHHSLDENEKMYLYAHYSSCLCGAMLRMYKSDNDSETLKPSIARLVHNPLVQKAFSESKFIREGFGNCYESMTQFDVAGVCSALEKKAEEDLAMKDKKDLLSPSVANRVLAKLFAILRKIFKTGRANRWLKIQEYNLTNVGIKNTLKIIFKK